MKKLVATVFALVIVATAAAADSYQLNYYANRNNLPGLDQVTYIINPGTVGTPISTDEGTLCANVYVFDATQEMQECCSCSVTANGILQLSLLLDLTQNPLTGFPAPNSGVIKIVSSRATGLTCPAGTETHPIVVDGLLAWQSHVLQPVSGTYVVTEDGFKPSPLDTTSNDPKVSEWAFLGQTCAFVQYLGSGKGQCTCGANAS